MLSPYPSIALSRSLPMHACTPYSGGMGQTAPTAKAGMGFGFKVGSLSGDPNPMHTGTPSDPTPLYVGLWVVDADDNTYY